MPSKLSEHSFRKGKFTTPLNSIMSSISEDESWIYGRMPEYFWIALIFDRYGRKTGLEKVYKILCDLHRLAPNISVPRISEILLLEPEIQREFYRCILKVIDKKTLTPLTLFLTLSTYPEFAKAFYTNEFDVTNRINSITRTMKPIMGHQTYDATDIRFVVLYFICMSGRLKIREEDGERLLKYPKMEHDNEEMRIIRPFVRSMELICLKLEKPNLEYLNCFWGCVSEMTECELMSIQFPKEETKINAYMEYIYEIFSYWVDLFRETVPLDDKTQVLLGIGTYSYKRLKEIYDHNLFNSIAGRSCIRVLIENYIMMKYLVKNESSHENIWKDYQFYGVGQYKLVLARHRESDEKRESHFDENYIEALVNEFVMEDAIDMDTRYFDKTNIRIKAESVDEKELYGLYYDYDSAFEHGLWGAIRESSMLKCNNPAHQYHCVPDIDDNNILKTVLPDCVYVMNKIVEFLKDIYGIPENLFEKVKKIEEKFINTRDKNITK